MEVFDLTEKSESSFILANLHLARLFWASEPSLIKIIGHPKDAPQKRVETIIHSDDLYQDLYHFFNLLLTHTIFISASFGMILFFSIYRFLGAPLERLTHHITLFHQNPESKDNIIQPSLLGGKIARAEKALSSMQTTLQETLKEQTRLARLGLAVSKINHDLRNILANALIISEDFAKNIDPDTRSKSQRLTSSLNKAIQLCTQVLDYGSARHHSLKISQVNVKKLVAMVGAQIASSLPKDSPQKWVNQCPDNITLLSDDNHLFRILFNLGRNGFQAQAHSIHIDAQISNEDEKIKIDIKDDARGLPQSVKARFTSSPHHSSYKGQSDNGYGLGLSISQELALDLGGVLNLVETSSKGTHFRLILPLDLGGQTWSQPKYPRKKWSWAKYSQPKYSQNDLRLKLTRHAITARVCPAILASFVKLYPVKP